MARLNREQLEALRRQARRRMYTGEGGPRTRVMVHMGSCGIAAGARAIEAAFREEFARSGLHGATAIWR